VGEKTEKREVKPGREADEERFIAVPATEILPYRNAAETEESA